MIFSTVSVYARLRLLVWFSMVLLLPTSSAAASAPAPKSILCFGDSLTFGVSPDFVLGAPFQYQHPEADRWTSVLKQQLNQRANVLVDGISGRTTLLNDPHIINANGLAFLGKSLHDNAILAPLDLVILALGTNDEKAQFSQTSGAIANNVMTLVQTIQMATSALKVKPAILVVSPPRLQENEYAKAFGFAGVGAKNLRAIAAIQNAVVNLASNSVRFFNMSSVAVSGTDGVHLSIDTNHRLGQALAPVVSDLLGLPRAAGFVSSFGSASSGSGSGSGSGSVSGSGGGGVVATATPTQWSSWTPWTCAAPGCGSNGYCNWGMCSCFDGFAGANCKLQLNNQGSSDCGSSVKDYCKNVAGQGCVVADWSPLGHCDGKAVPATPLFSTPSIPSTSTSTTSDPCKGRTCNGRGSCFSSNGMCACAAGFTGKDCEISGGAHSAPAPAPAAAPSNCTKQVENFCRGVGLGCLVTKNNPVGQCVGTPAPPLGGTEAAVGYQCPSDAHFCTKISDCNCAALLQKVTVKLKKSDFDFCWGCRAVDVYADTSGVGAAPSLDVQVVDMYATTRQGAPVNAIPDASAIPVDLYANAIPPAVKTSKNKGKKKNKHRKLSDMLSFAHSKGVRH